MLEEIYGVAIDFIYVLFLRELLIYLGLDNVLATFTSPILVILFHVLSIVDIKLLNISTLKKAKIPLVMELRGKVVYREIKINKACNTILSVNFSGAIVPLVTSIILLMRFTSLSNFESSHMLEYVLIIVLTYSVLTIYVNKVTVTGNSFIGVPLIKTLIITVVFGCLIGMKFGVMASFVSTYVITYFSLITGNELMGLKKIMLNDSKVLSVGGAGIADSLSLLPAASALLGKYLTIFLHDLILLIPSLT